MQTRRYLVFLLVILLSFTALAKPSHRWSLNRVEMKMPFQAVQKLWGPPIEKQRDDNFVFKTPTGRVKIECDERQKPGDLSVFQISGQTLELDGKELCRTPVTVKALEALVKHKGVKYSQLGTATWAEYKLDESLFLWAGLKGKNALTFELHLYPSNIEQAKTVPHP